MTDIDIATLNVEELQRLRDAVNQRLLELRSNESRNLSDLLRMLEDLKVTLQDQGKEWRSLERWQYIDGEIRFWLNPTDQNQYRSGWYTIDELLAWVRNSGPVLVPFEDEDDDDDWTEIDGVRIRWLPDGSLDRSTTTSS
ncbi:hypothetical protein HC891_07820 [Candidatus Gracilibacteria bacterium]|nr:hypothetical protein [Candidatus Gracilibacteria bacterium]